jgi:hypothetical protein
MPSDLSDALEAAATQTSDELVRRWLLALVNGESAASEAIPESIEA